MQRRKNANPTHGFEHVKRYAGSNAGKRGVCSDVTCSINGFEGNYPIRQPIWDKSFALTARRSIITGLDSVDSVAALSNDSIVRLV